ncbi:MAG: alpha/beta hydrolase [Deltaproteobacteria bacterium]|nr:alpha/beta hydrolase [Deltaproteobacteria bacterium]
MIEPNFAGVAPPQRTHTIDSAGVRLNALSWGDPAAQPLVMCHGMWDHARSFALLAPLLARRFHVLAIDARGHGDSSWADAYTWPNDILDIVNVLRSLGRPAHLLGHSKGGGQVTDAACAAPELVMKVINIDGFGPLPLRPEEEPTPARFAQFLDGRRKFSQHKAWRPYAGLDELVERRRAQNPRLSREWLRYFLFHGARADSDGWRWKHDPIMGHGFGPWRPEWIGPSYAALRVPLLALVGSEPDTWGPLPQALLAERLAHVNDLQVRTIAGAGHFVHMEKPVETAAAVIDFLES